MVPLAVPRESNSVSQEERVQPITDPTHLRRLEFKDFKYLGAFRLPAGEANGESFSFGGGPLAFNPKRNSMFAGSKNGKVAEVTVPEPVESADVAVLPFSEYLQPFQDPSDGGMKTIGEEGGAGLSGLLVHGDKLYGSGVIYYDANNTQSLSHFWRPLALSARGASPPQRVWSKGKTGFVAGYMAAIPPEWQSRLGGTAVTGQCCIPVVTRTSWGPSAFAWSPDEFDGRKAVDARPLLYYDSEHPTLGQWEGSNPTYGGTIQMGGVALLDGTRTAVFVGRNGTGEFCYGTGTADKSLLGKPAPDGGKYCYDPAYASKAQHAYPYRYQMWAYDLSEWAQVRADKKDPWDVKPYGVWPFDLPFPEPGTRIGGVAWDSAKRRLYVAQFEADVDGYSHRSMIHVYQVP